jgi:hypothetical protein
METEVISREIDNSSNNKILSNIEVNINDVDSIENQYAKISQESKVNLQTTSQLQESKYNHQLQKIVNKFENAKESIDRETLLEVAKTLNIKHKNGAIVEQDKIMFRKSGNNLNPKIVNIDNLFDNKINLKELTRKAEKIAIEIYANNDNGYTFVNNIDTKTKYELGRKGINKTFSKNVPFSKLSTTNKLLEIGEQGIYFETSYNPNDTQSIKYHHFLTPVKSVTDNGNAFIRSVVKEYTKNNKMNNKFYYHQFEYLNNNNIAKKGTTDLRPNNKVTQAVGNSFYDNNIAHNNEKVKSFIVNNSNMQDSENNDINL